MFLKQNHSVSPCHEI